MSKPLYTQKEWDDLKGQRDALLEALWAIAGGHISVSDAELTATPTIDGLYGKLQTIACEAIAKADIDDSEAVNKETQRRLGLGD